MKIITIGILGLGTVGGGTANILQNNAKSIAQRLGAEIRIKSALVKDLTQARICDCSDIELTTNAADIINDPEIDIVLELIGGCGYAKELIEAAVRKGKHVVTANKALIALHGNELFALAESNGVRIAYESSVAGGIPVVKAIREGLAGNEITLVAGIINGTGNFILSEMAFKGRAFSDVLVEAQELGYAEADPTFDVEGIDAAHKLAILASIAFGIPLSFEKIYTKGISELSLEDVVYADELGYKIKHLGIAKRNGNSIELRVHPTLIPQERLLANVNGVMNAVLVRGDAVGNTLHYGAGAGAGPTGSSVVADIMDIARLINSEKAMPVPHLGFDASDAALAILNSDQFVCPYYLRLEVEDVAGVMAQLTQVFAKHKISIEAMVQKEPASASMTVPIVMITEACVENLVQKAINEVKEFDFVHSDIVKIRVEHLD